MLDIGNMFASKLVQEIFNIKEYILLYCLDIPWSLHPNWLVSLTTPTVESELLGRARERETKIISHGLPTLRKRNYANIPTSNIFCVYGI